MKVSASDTQNRRKTPLPFRTSKRTAHGRSRCARQPWSWHHLDTHLTHVSALSEKWKMHNKTKWCCKACGDINLSTIEEEVGTGFVLQATFFCNDLDVSPNFLPTNQTSWVVSPRWHWELQICFLWLEEWGQQKWASYSKWACLCHSCNLLSSFECVCSWSQRTMQMNVSKHFRAFVFSLQTETSNFAHNQFFFEGVTFPGEHVHAVFKVQLFVLCHICKTISCICIIQHFQLCWKKSLHICFCQSQQPNSGTWATHSKWHICQQQRQWSALWVIFACVHWPDWGMQRFFNFGQDHHSAANKIGHPNWRSAKEGGKA